MTQPKELEWVLVDCIDQYRMRYLVQVPAGHKDWALDTVAMEQAKEFSQKYLGETVVAHRVISQAEALELVDEDNPYIANSEFWPAEKKMQVFFTHDKEVVEDEWQ